MDQEQLLKQGMAAVKAGQRAEARRLLEQVVQADPQSEQGWLWLSGAVDTPEERRFCLARVLAINPDNTAARRGLEKLGPEPAVSPLPAEEESPAEPVEEVPLMLIEERPSSEPEEAPGVAEEEPLFPSEEAPSPAVSLEEKERLEPEEKTPTPTPEIDDVPLPDWDWESPFETAAAEEEIPLPDWGQEVPVESTSGGVSLAEGEEEAPAAGAVEEGWPAGDEATTGEEIVCPRCGTGNPPKAEVCQRCGAFIHRPTAPERAPAAQEAPLPAEERFPAVPGEEFSYEEQPTAEARTRTSPILIAIAVILLVACLTLVCIASLSMWQVPG